uniref:Kielin/chordin-like protein n=1 Tax=Phallusia mammillata TaxID=59560 RepID=A0A6F9DGH3_9ASCI|nr:kielin/chordin-like protein [Phallusia mammillata]
MFKTIKSFFLSTSNVFSIATVRCDVLFSRNLDAKSLTSVIRNGPTLCLDLYTLHRTYSRYITTKSAIAKAAKHTEKHEMKSNIRVTRNLDESETSIEANFDLDTEDTERRHHQHVRHHRLNDVIVGNFTFPDEVPKVEETNYTQMCEQGLLADDNQVTWHNEDCHTCRCQGATAICQQETCPSLDCQHPVSVESKCCPMCPDQVCKAADGRFFAEGADWHLDDCTFCECKQGRVLCSIEDCEFKSCKTPHKVPGRCCPVCPDTSCYENNGMNHTAGTVWKEDVCTHCYCGNGEKLCAEEKCPHINCTNPYQPEGQCCLKCLDAIECVVSTWGDWGECPIQECGGGMRRRYRSVVIPPRNGGAFCPHMSEAQLCPRTPCNDIPVCPVTKWSTWSHCTATCGNGRRIRMRREAKVTKATMTSLIDCSQTHMQESMRCYTGTCNIAPRSMISNEPADTSHCQNLAWSAWSKCSKSCGRGNKVRQQIPANTSTKHGERCHLLQMVKKCHGHNCSSAGVNCKVTAWGTWTPCTATCGDTARKTKHRMIKRHPTEGGKPCPKLKLTKSCRLPACTKPMFSIFHGEEGCVSDDGQTHYDENESWISEDCLTCRCVNSVKQCGLDCSKLGCEDPSNYDRGCCSLCATF